MKNPFIITTAGMLNLVKNECNTGKIFTVEFEKRTEKGAMRRFVGRKGVVKGLKGGKLPYDADNKMLVTMHVTHGYKLGTDGKWHLAPEYCGVKRVFPIEGIHRLRANGIEYGIQAVTKTTLSGSKI